MFPWSKINSKDKQRLRRRNDTKERTILAKVDFLQRSSCEIKEKAAKEKRTRNSRLSYYSANYNLLVSLLDAIALSS